MNSLVDARGTEALYRASSAGVEVDLIIRGACTVVPGVERLSARIRSGPSSASSSTLADLAVRERRRAGVDIGSADLMDRTSIGGSRPSRRSSTPRLAGSSTDILATLLDDDRRAWALASDGRWHRVEGLAQAGPASTGRAAAFQGAGAVPRQRWPPRSATAARRPRLALILGLNAPHRPASALNWRRPRFDKPRAVNARSVASFTAPPNRLGLANEKRSAASAGRGHMGGHIE